MQYFKEKIHETFYVKSCFSAICISRYFGILGNLWVSAFFLSLVDFPFSTLLLFNFTHFLIYLFFSLPHSLPFNTCLIISLSFFLLVIFCYMFLLLYLVFSLSFPLLQTLSLAFIFYFFEFFVHRSHIFHSSVFSTPFISFLLFLMLIAFFFSLLLMLSLQSFSLYNLLFHSLSTLASF